MFNTWKRLREWLTTRAGGTGLRRKPRHMRPQVEVLEARDCPATITWLGGNDGMWNNANNWVGGVAPTANDDVVFDGNYSTANCTFTGAGLTSQDIMAHSIALTGNYTGTLHLQQLFPAQIGPGGITEANGAIEQDSGQDINTGGDYQWSGGNINVSSGLLANVNVAPGKTINMTGSGVWQTGSQLNLTKGARAVLNEPGDGNGIQFNNNAGIFIDNQSAFNWVDGKIMASPSTSNFILNKGTFTKSIGTADQVYTWLSITNFGTFQVQQGWVSVMGSINGWGFEQSGGTMDLFANSALSVAFGDFKMNGGKFYTEGSTASLIIHGGAGTAWFEGGVINLRHGDQNKTGTLKVTGALAIEGNTEWDCKVDCTTTGEAVPQDVDKIVATGDITLADLSTLKAIGINIPGGGVPANDEWDFLQTTGAGKTINGDFDMFYLAFNDGTGKSWTQAVSMDRTTYSLNS